MLLESPTAIPGYRIEQLLERRPGSWTVYQATEEVGYRPVALTVMGAQLNHDAAYGERMLDDMRRLATLEHPHLVPVLAAGRAPRGLYVASELPDILTLESMLGLRPLEPDDLVGLFAPIADLLDHAHAEGLIHRGLSPAAIAMSPDGRARVTGFGLADPVAAALGPDRRMLACMAPELRGGGHASARSDVYSLAATMLSCLTGVDPVAQSPGGSHRRPAAHDRRGGAAARVEWALGRALTEAPARRPASAGRLLEDVRTALTGSRAPRGSEPAAVVPRPAADAPAHRPARASRSGAPAGPARRSRRGLTPLIPAAVLAALAGTGVAALGSDGGDPPAKPPPRPVAASTERLSLTASSAWSPVERPAAVPGVALDDPIALVSRAAGGAAEGVLTAGWVSDVDARLLPPDFDEELTPPAAPEHVRVGRYEGYRYAGVKVKGSARELDLYVVPTSEGAATVACQASAGSGTFMRRCEAVATTLELSGGGVTPEPVGPSPEYVAALRRTVSALDAARRDARLALAQATTAAEQARRAGQLAGIYGAAAARQARAPRRLSTAPFNEQLVESLRDVRAAYGSLALAAGRQSPAAYAARRATVSERERRLQALLAGFSRS